MRLTPFASVLYPDLHIVQSLRVHWCIGPDGRLFGLVPHQLDTADFRLTLTPCRPRALLLTDPTRTLICSAHRQRLGTGSQRDKASSFGVPRNSTNVGIESVQPKQLLLSACNFAL